MVLAIAGITRGLTAADFKVPEDYRTIQAAIDSASRGDVVVVSAGTYTERITLKAGVQLRSAGDDAKGEAGLLRAESTIIDGGRESGLGAGVAMAEGSGIDGFTIQNVGVYDEAEWQKHFDTHGEHQSYEHIGAPSIAGISAIGVECVIRHNIVRHNGHSGIVVMGEPGRRVAPFVENNMCYRNMGGGISAMRGTAATIQHNVCFENLFAGIGHSSASPLVTANVCYRNVRGGIGISEGSSPLIRGNRCFLNQRAGIGIRSGIETRPIVEDNDCYENAYAGIGVREEAAPILCNNRCYKNKEAGIGIRTGANALIVGNECYENEQAGIGQRCGTTSVLRDNYIHHNRASGIGFDAGEKGKSLVVNNRIIDNATVAVGVHSGWNVEFVGNELSRSGGLEPIAMIFEGASAVFARNTLRGGGVAGIRASGAVIASDNQFDGTGFRAAGPPNFAIWALEGSSITMRGNRIRGWRHALLSSKGMVITIDNFIGKPSKAAFVIVEPIAYPIISDNVLVPANPNDVIATVDGRVFAVDENRIVSEEEK